MKMEAVLHMNAGLGESSYAQNSTLFQKNVSEIVEPMLEEAILSMKLTVECKTFCIADLGCSSGPNAPFAAENITKTLKAKYLSAGITFPRCQVFFNDLPASDFNSLFRILPSFSVNTDLQNEGVAVDRSYFVAGVPGSFYGRLFPDETLHFVHSSFGLHWLSQKSVLEIVEPMLEEAILSMKLTVECKTFCIADLGCSSGPNALFAADNITKTLKAKYLCAGITVPQCQVFFNDLPASDFNSLFRILPSFSVNTDLQHDGGAVDRSYFAAGVPGSFYGRLFPDETLHFVHSSYSLHWFSQVPAEILDKKSVTWNKGKIFCEGSRAVGEAYFRQYQRDFNAFLRARAQELVRGGRMFLVLMGRTSRDPTDQGFVAFAWESLGGSLNDLVSQGLIEKEKVYSFNLPLYAPCPEEVSSEVTREGSFEIRRLELLRKSERITEEEMEAMTGLSASLKDAYGRKLAKQLRAVTESLIKQHFGEEIMDVFERFGEIMGKRLSERMEYGKKGGHLVIVLERK